jgi:GNAT superfamily N-acetyltransferase
MIRYGVSRMSCQDLIKKCDQEDEEVILKIINESAKSYRGVIPEDCYHEPYMSLEELRKEMHGMTFFAYQERDKILGVAGYQPVEDVVLVRHIYVLSEHQRRGVGRKLLRHIIRIATTRRILVGTWEAAAWAIRFYEKHGFKLQPNKDELLRAYWEIPERQIDLSVVLALDKSRCIQIPKVAS